MKIAVFPGSFDPFTVAHLDLVRRALPLFDKVIVAIGVNSSKQGLLEFAVREKAIQELFAGENAVEVKTFKGLTVDFCEQEGAQFILRGLRNGTDLDFENAIAQNNLKLAPDIETYFLLSRGSLAHVSSTIVRDILQHGGDITDLVPTAILNFIKSAK